MAIHASKTPTLDQLCRNGVRFSRAYSETPVCVPARCTLMTGTSPRVHGDRTFQGALPMPELPTLAQTFRNAGYQAYAVGKLHVYPQRNRIGFDDVILAEEGRAQFGVVDDYELFLGDRGCAGQQFNHGMGKWAEAIELLPSLLRERRAQGENFTDYQMRAARRAFYALCTHIDHQLRVVLGTLREQGVLNNTIIMFTADHGDILGQHGLWAKKLYYRRIGADPHDFNGRVRRRARGNTAWSTTVWWVGKA